MKKLLVIILATLTVLALAAGCAKPEAEAPSPSSASATSPAPTPSPAPGSGEAEEIPVYSWEEAIDHIGETATVIGPIINLWDPAWTGTEFGGDIMLGMGKVWGVQGYMNIVLKGDMAKISLDEYIGKTVSVRGVIYLKSPPWPAPTIDVTDLSQIEIID